MKKHEVELVSDLMKRLHVARKECRNYDPTHPVSIKAAEGMMELMEVWFKSHDEMVAVFDGHTISVDGVPLTNLGDVGSQLVAVFKEYGVAQLVFELGLAKEQLMILFQVLNDKAEDEEDKVGWINKAIMTGGGFIRAYREGEKRDTKKNKEDNSLDNIPLFYNSSVTVIQNILESVSSGNVIDVEQIRRLSRQMVSAILDEPKKLFLVTTSHPDFREDLFAHSLDVAIVATSLAATLNRERAWLEEVMFCGIVHDVGKSVIPKEILYKPGKLDAAEWEIMMTHAEKGGHILYGVKGVGNLAPQVAFEHQAKFNLTGYPKLKFKKKLHPVTQLVIIADTYSALTAYRAYKRPFSPGKSLAIMEEMSGSAFKPRLFNQFVAMTNFYSSGTKVLLSSGETGVILKTFANHAMRPLVQIEDMPDSSDLKSGDVIDLNEKDPYSGKYRWHLVETMGQTKL